MRPMRAVIKGLDRQGETQQYEGTGLLARAFQHEMDHLNGVLFIDHISRLKRSRVIKKFEKAARGEPDEAPRRPSAG